MSEFGPRPTETTVSEQIFELLDDVELDTEKARQLIFDCHDQMALGDLLQALPIKRDQLRPPPVTENNRLDDDKTHEYLLKQRFLLGVTILTTNRIAYLSGKRENPTVSN